MFGVAVAEALTAGFGVLVTGMSYAAARDSFLIPNVVIGVGCAVCGVLIASQRPDNALGWLLLAAGVCQCATPVVTPWLLQALQTGASHAVVRTLATCYSFCWPWSLSVFIPLTLLCFPDGRLPGRMWQWVAVAAGVNGVVQVLLFSADRNPLGTVAELRPEATGRAGSWLSVLPSDGPPWLQAVSDATLVAIYFAALAGLVLRYRRGDEPTRRQLLWLLLATVVTTVFFLLARVTRSPQAGPGLPVALFSVVVVIPVAIAIAVLRYRLLDIRLVWSRTLTYALLTAAVVLIYVGVVQAADQVLRRELGIGPSVLATLLIAASFNPVRTRLQRWVDRLVYGQRGDPLRAAAAVTAQLSAAERPADVLPAICHALRLPYAALYRGEQLVGAHGQRPDTVERVVLEQAGEPPGELVVGVRPGQRRLDPADHAVLRLVAAPIGIAMRAIELSAALQRSRQGIVAAREEERRRLRRDLHDGLGPLLTGITLQADAVTNVMSSDLRRAQVLVEQIRAGAAGAIDDVRRMLYRLRPAALDELGLVDALRRHAQQLDRRADGAPLEIVVRAPDSLPGLPAAVELAAYRVATEAMLNIARHSTADQAVVDLGVICEHGDELLITIQDDGCTGNGARPAWRPGVGITSMTERTAELGGTLDAGPTDAGGRVAARIPLGVTP
jgi:signal transduction histidine kinase